MTICAAVARLPDGLEQSKLRAKLLRYCKHSTVAHQRWFSNSDRALRHCGGGRADRADTGHHVLLVAQRHRSIGHDTHKLWRTARRPPVPCDSILTESLPANASPDPVPYNYSFLGPTPSGPSLGSTTVTVAAAPVLPPSGCTITPSPSSLPSPGNVTLTASCSGGSAPTIFGWTASPPVKGLPTSTDGASIGPVNIAQTTTFTLTPANSAGHGNTASTTVSVGPAIVPPSGCTVASSRSSLPFGGGDVTLIASCLGGSAPTTFAWTASPPVAGLPTSTDVRSLNVNITQTTIFTVTPSNAGGSGNPASTVVSVATMTQPSGCTVSASPSSLPFGGGNVALTSSCSGGSAPAAFTWTASPPVSGLPTSTSGGSLTANITQTTTFTVTPSNPAGPGNTGSTTVSVAVVTQPSGCTITPSPSSLPFSGEA